MTDPSNTQLHEGERFVRNHLATLAAEIIEMQDKAQLGSGRFRELVQILRPLAGPDAQSVAEALVKRAALEMVSVIPAAQAGATGSLQTRVRPWILKSLGPDSANDLKQRNQRFLEETIELVQACSCTREEVLQAVEYVYQRPIGEKYQEIGGVMITLAALCLAQGLDMHQAGEDELARIWIQADQIRAKQEAKPLFDAVQRLSIFDEGLAIADQAMVELLESEGVSLDDARSRFAPADENQGEVRTLDEASEDFKEAVAWLFKRGLATVEADADGDVIILAPQILAGD